jgi:hypothetical protein
VSGADGRNGSSTTTTTTTTTSSSGVSGADGRNGSSSSAASGAGDSGGFPGRYRVRYGDGSFYHVQPKRLVRLYGRDALLPGETSQGAREEERTTTPPPTIVVTASTSHYRQLARTQCLPQESALEIGSDLGLCTSVLDAALGAGGGHAVGIDKSAGSVAEARRRFPAISFRCEDVLSEDGACLRRRPRRRRRRDRGEEGGEGGEEEGEQGGGGGGGGGGDGGQQEQEFDDEEGEGEGEEEGGRERFDLVFIDINGNRMLPHVLRCVDVVLRAYEAAPPRLIVVKSSEMSAELAKGRVFGSGP